jgi:hypothetical protein
MTPPKSTFRFFKKSSDEINQQSKVRNADPSDWTDLIGKMNVCDDVDAKHLSPIKQNHQLAVRPEMFADTPVRVISARD